MRGIYYNGQHSWYTHHAVISQSDKPVPKKRLVEETVPYSNVMYDFFCLNGKQTYEDRTLKYILTFWSATRAGLLRKINDMTNWLYSPKERISLWDDEEEGHHYLAKCTAIDSPAITGCVCRLTVTFTAYPLRIPDRPSVVYTTATAPYPNVNLDGVANASDASLILQAAAAIGAGGDSGLTEEQLDRADADRDGSITASDAALLLAFSSECGAGSYLNSHEGWVQFLNDQNARQEGCI